MICSRCNSVIPEGMVACLHCIRVAQVMSDRATWKRGDQLWFKAVHESEIQTLWVQVEKAADGTEIHHFAQECSIDFMSISFCGLDISRSNSEHVFIMGRQQRPNFTPDERNCPLCWDRLMSRGGGICAGICLACGGKDDTHKAGCVLRMPEPGQKIRCESPESPRSRRRLLSDEIRDIQNSETD